MAKHKFNLFKSIDEMATEIPVKNIMVKNIKTVKEDASVKDVLKKMGKYSISGVIVTDKDDYPLGIVSEGDLIRKVLLKDKNPKKVKVSKVMSKSLLTIKPDLSLGNTSNLMKKHNISKLPVIEDKKLVGLVTKSDLVEKLNEIYYQNTKLRWYPIILLVQFIVIVLLILGYVNK